MRTKDWTLSACMLAILFLVMGCSADVGTAIPSGPTIQSIVLSPADQPLVSMGQLVQISAVVTDSDGATVSNPSLNWSSSNDAILTVGANGMSQGEAGGTATVSASVGGKTGSLTIRIVDLTGTWTGGTPPDMVTYTLTQTGASVPGTFGSLFGFPPITNVKNGVLTGSLNFERYEHVLTVITESSCEMRITGTYLVQVDPSGDLVLVGAGNSQISSPNCNLNGTIGLATLQRQ